MGNVQASNSGPPPTTLPPPPVPEATPAESQGVGTIHGGEDKKEAPIVESFPNNPGTMEDLNKKCKDVFPVFFEGAKFMLNKPLTPHFQVSHTINFSTMQPPGYKFGTTFVGANQVSQSESYPVLLGEIDPSGNLNANIIHQFAAPLRTKFVAQIQQSKWQVTQFTADWRAKNFTASLTLGNVDIINGSGLTVWHYLQKVSDRVDLGAELAYQFGPHVPGGQMAVHSFAGKYNGDDFTASGTLGAAGVHLCYYQKASETLQFGVELETSLRLPESTASIAYQVDIPKANYTFRGTLDSNWTVGAVLEKKLLPMPFTFAISATLNHPKNQFKLGCGLIVG